MEVNRSAVLYSRGEDRAKFGFIEEMAVRVRVDDDAV